MKLIIYIKELEQGVMGFDDENNIMLICSEKLYNERFSVICKIEGVIKNSHWSKNSIRLHLKMSDEIIVYFKPDISYKRLCRYFQLFLS